MQGKFVRFAMLAMLLAGPSLGLAGAPRSVGDERSSPEGEPTPFLLSATSVRGWITGTTAHVEVTQTWQNSNADPVDALYIFPLPDNAAVTDMSLRIGSRVIRGTMRRREEARRIYEDARREGRLAGLLDQERANLFAQRVANLAPGETIQVLLALDHEVDCDGAACEYHFPTVVGPRFIPLRQSDPGAIAPPVVAPGRATRQRLSLELDLEAGVPIHSLESPSHAITVQRLRPGVEHISLAENGTELLNRDFRLRWRVGGEQPEVGVLAWRDAARLSEPGVFTLLLQPPAELAEEAVVAPRELIFVLDCSGSMMGAPLEAAKKVVRQALGSVRPQDTFQIVRFSDTASGLGSRALPATPGNLRRALAYLDTLRGEGGTEMIAGIRAALGFPSDPTRVRIVAFLTDGYIGNEREILAEVRRKIGTARLFSFGIGSSVNRYLLEGLAEEGRGTAEFLGPRETPDQMVESFVQRISTPLLTDVRITWSDLEVMDLLPERVPDLFAGQPLILRGRYRRPGTGVVEVEGFSGGIRRIYRRVVTLPESAEDHEALGRLWARARIHQLERELHDGKRAEIVESIVSLGLRHHLMTAYTSLVAVDSEISNWTGSASQVSVPVEMPEDVSYRGVFGEPSRSNIQGRSISLGASPAPLANLGYIGGRWEDSLRHDGPPAMQERPGIRPDQSKLPQKGAAGGSATGTDGRTESASGPGAVMQGPGPSFSRITLFESSEKGLIVEASGKVFRWEQGRRVYLKTLGASALDSIRQALTAAHTGLWSGAATGPRIELEAEGARRSTSLRPDDAGLQTLAALLRSFAGEGSP